MPCVLPLGPPASPGSAGLAVAGTPGSALWGCAGSMGVVRLVPLQLGVSCRTEEDAGPLTPRGVPWKGEGRLLCPCDPEERRASAGHVPVTLFLGTQARTRRLCRAGLPAAPWILGAGVLSPEVGGQGQQKSDPGLLRPACDVTVTGARAFPALCHSVLSLPNPLGRGGGSDVVCRAVLVTSCLESPEDRARLELMPRGCWPSAWLLLSCFQRRVIHKA